MMRFARAVAEVVMELKCCNEHTLSALFLVVAINRGPDTWGQA